MKKGKRILAMLLMGCVLLAQTNMTVSASEKGSAEAVYDMSLGGTQEFVIQDEDGQTARIVIEEMQGKARVDAGTYKVQYEAPGWTAGFYVEVSNNKFSNVYAPYYSPNWGKITNVKLTQNSNIKATLSFVFKAVISYDTGVICTITNGTMKVTKR